MKFLAALLLLIAFSGLSYAGKDVKGEWKSHDKSIVLVYYEDEIWEEYDYNTGKTNKYKTVGETKSGFIIITPLNHKSHKIFKAVGPKRILIKEKSIEYIESYGKEEIKGSWIKNPLHCKSPIRCKHDPCSAHKSCKGYRKAQCYPDYCKNCKSTKWFDKEVLVKCETNESHSESNEDKKSHYKKSYSWSNSRSEKSSIKKCWSQKKKFAKQLDLLGKNLIRKEQKEIKKALITDINVLEKDIQDQLKQEIDEFKAFVESFPNLKKEVEPLLQIIENYLIDIERKIKELPEIRDLIKHFKDDFKEDVRELTILINIELKFLNLLGSGPFWLKPPPPP